MNRHDLVAEKSLASFPDEYLPDGDKQAIAELERADFGVGGIDAAERLVSFSDDGAVYAYDLTTATCPTGSGSTRGIGISRRCSTMPKLLAMLALLAAVSALYGLIAGIALGVYLGGTPAGQTVLAWLAGDAAIAVLAVTIGVVTLAVVVEVGDAVAVVRGDVEEALLEADD
jgi:hypothetical protein